MSKDYEKHQVIKLRKEGNSYSYIKKYINVSKSTLSRWLKDYPLSSNRIRELRDWNMVRIENYRNTRRKQREDRTNKLYLEQKRVIFPFSNRDFFIAGLFLYWGEGTKTRDNGLVVANTDPSILCFFIKWLDKVFKVPKSKLKIALHLYSDMDKNQEINYWINILGIDEKQFVKPYIKLSKISGLTRKGTFGHGTCSVRIDDVRIAERVIASIKVIRSLFKGQGSK